MTLTLSLHSFRNRDPLLSVISSRWMQALPLSFKIGGENQAFGQLHRLYSRNFRGSGKTFELQNAYLSFLGFTMGYDTGLFMDLAAAPPTIDFKDLTG